MGKNTLSRQALETIIENISGSGLGEFRVGDIIAQLQPPPQDKEELENAESMVKNLLEVDDTIFSFRGRHIRKEVFFQAAEFCVTPDAAEIERGILVPGHRFAIFCEPEVFISEITLESCGQRFRRRKHEAELEELVPYYTLFGLEQINDYLFADADDNYQSLHNKKGGKLVVTVFDLKKFYKEHSFKAGDALKVVVKDWQNGEFELSYLPFSQRNQNELRAWEKNYGDALEQVVAEFDNYLDVSNQLSYAFFVGGKQLLTATGMSLDEFYHGTERFEMRLENGETYLGLASDDLPEEEVSVPEGISISQGKTSNLDEILAEIGMPLRTEEVESYMLDQHFRRELEFADFFSRCFGDSSLPFLDEAQEIIFMNMLEDRWEKITNSYNRHEDESKAPVRERILELTDERISLLCRALVAGVPPKPAEREIAELGKLSAKLGGVLRLLNTESFTLTAEDAENTLELLDKDAQQQQELLDTISRKLEL